MSVGTYDAVVRRPRFLDRAGALLWARSVTDVLLRSGSIAVNNQARYLLGKENVLRIDPRVPAAEVSIDRVSGLDALVARARHHSRHIMPDVHRLFVDHRAPVFTPLYTP